MEKVKILRNQRLSKRIYLLEIEAKGRLLEFKPGQFLKVQIPDGPFDPLFPRPFTVHSFQGKTLKILYQVVGRGTQALSRLPEGEKLLVLGPLGRPYPHSLEYPLGLCAGGVGIAGFGFFLEKLPKERREKIFLYYGAKTAQDLVRLDYFQGFPIEIKIATEDGSLGEKGFITEILERDLAEGRIKTLLSCGPLPMLKVVKELSEIYGVKAYLSLETFMACGTGFCRGCVIRKKEGSYFHLCEDGPTLPAWEVIL
ncbi:MAG: dihydroorotate dehydrogenase electron transfer subunit [Caldimicrobium sp.]